MDGNTYTPTITSGAFSQSLTFTTEKTYTITVTATDAVGNTSSSQRNIIYDSIDNIASILLASGWNLISLPLSPSDTAIATVLSGISGKYTIVQ